MKTLSGIPIKNYLLLLPVVATALLAPSAALAQPYWLQYQLIVGAIGGPSNPNYDSGLVQVTNLLTTSISIPEARDEAYANPGISYGWLQFNAGCSVNNNPSDGNGYGSYFGNSVVSFQDTLTITSATLPAGTPVQVQITCVYNGSITPGVGSGWDSTSSSASVGLTVRENGMGSNPNTFNGTVGGANQTNTLLFIAQVTVGDNNLIILPSITANGSVNNQDGAPFSGSVSASISSQTYVDVLTPGAGYTSASGTVYPHIAFRATHLGHPAGHQRRHAVLAGFINHL